MRRPQKNNRPYDPDVWPMDMKNVYHPDIHHRRSIRLKEHDYSQAGAYFVTICTKDRECLFGEITGGQMVTNEYGQAVQSCWDNIPNHFSHVQMDIFMVMPNHVHGILILENRPNVRATHASPLRKGSVHGPKSHSLGAVVGSFKSAVTKHINTIRRAPGLPVWQRNYYEHIIRDENEAHRIRQYITANPMQWLEDEENLANIRTP